MRHQSPRKGFAAGTFDLFHIGHLRYLQFARRVCDHLSVGIRGDALETPGKPGPAQFPQEIRAELVAGLRCVDAVEIFTTSLDQAPYWADWLLANRIAVVVIGGDWQGTPRWNRLGPLLEGRGIELVFAPRTHGVASRDIAARLGLEGEGRIPR